jgi:hypothetical protein
VPLDTSEETAIRNLIVSSQNYEIDLYRSPMTFKESDLSKYWMPPPPDDQGQFDWTLIKNGVSKLSSEHHHYAEEIIDAQTGKIIERGAGNEVLEILSIRAYNNGYTAEVETKEKWYLRGCQMNCVSEFPSSAGTRPS